MRLLINLLSGRSGGGVSYARNLVPLLARKCKEGNEDHRLSLLLDQSQLELLDSALEADLVTVPAGMSGWVQRFQWERKHLSRVCRERRIDVLFVPNQLGRRVLDVRLVLMLRNMEPFRFLGYRYGPRAFLRNLILRLVCPWNLRNSDRVIAVSRFARNVGCRSARLDPAKVRTVYHGRDVSFVPEDANREDEAILKRLGVEGEYVFSAGSVLPYRRYEDVVEGFADGLTKTSERSLLVIAGSGTDDGYRTIIRERIARTGLESRIRMVGHVTRREMLALYRGSRVFVFSSEVEACPNIAIEAMSSGCAVLSSDAPPLVEVFSGASETYGQRSVDELSFKLTRLWRDEPRRVALSRRALARAEAFSWENCADQTLRFLTQWERE